MLEFAKSDIHRRVRYLDLAERFNLLGAGDSAGLTPSLFDLVSAFRVPKEAEEHEAVTEYQPQPQILVWEEHWRRISKDNAVMKATKQHQAQLTSLWKRSLRLMATLRRPHCCRRC